jgi:hypothetical protein
LCYLVLVFIFVWDLKLAFIRIASGAILTEPEPRRSIRQETIEAKNKRDLELRSFEGFLYSKKLKKNNCKEKTLL